MSAVRNLIRDIERAMWFTVSNDKVLSNSEWEAIKAKYADKPAKKIPAIRKMPRVRKTVVRLRDLELAELRCAVYHRDEGKCVDCGKGLSISGPFCPMELSHIKSRGAGGSDTMENTVCRCRECHAKSHNAGGKPVPSKGTHIR